MIQRIQTVFLFFVAVAMILVVTFPIWQQVNPDQSQMLTLTAWSLDKIDTQTQEIIQSDGNSYLGILALVAAVLALFSLTQFKNRTKQMFINMINSIVMVLTLSLIIWTSHQANASLNPEMNGAFVVGFWSIFGGMIMNLLANRFIRKDEMLVRSVDRIR
jgi:hypothetical protein